MLTAREHWAGVTGLPLDPSYQESGPGLCQLWNAWSLLSPRLTCQHLLSGLVEGLGTASALPLWGDALDPSVEVLGSVFPEHL